QREDAVVTFRHETNSAGAVTRAWTSDQIEMVDKAFAVLQQKTGNAILLKLSNSLNTGGGLEFERVGREDIAGDNDSAGRIRLSDNGLQGNETWQIGNVQHEIAHNWDWVTENPQTWRTFMAQSSWTRTDPATSLQPDGQGGYIAPQGSQGTLAARPGGGYTLTE